jgi:hypothetical protein
MYRILTILLAAFLSGAAAPHQNRELVYRVTVTVAENLCPPLTECGEPNMVRPVQGATVDLNGIKKSTNKQGVATFVVHDRQVRVVVFADGYETQTLDADTKPELHVELQRPHR